MFKTFRIVSFIEGLSFIALLFIAMPLKYQFDMPEAVRIVGPIHGVLWLIYIVASLAASHEKKWSVVYWALMLLLSVTPFGFVVAEILFKKQLSADNDAGQAESAA